MKEFVHTSGHLGRRWHSSEWVTVQQQDLQIMQDYFGAPGKASAISGIEVTSSNISAGLAVIKHADGWKIVSFPGAVGVSFPYYLQVTKTTTNKLYNDSTNQVASTTYAASSASPGGTPATDVYLKITADGAVRWEAALGAACTTAWETLPLASGSPYYTFTGSVKIRKNVLSNTAHIMGSLLITWNSGIGGAPTAGMENADTGIDAKYRPAADAYFPAMLSYDGSAGTYYLDQAGADRIVMITACLTATGDLNIDVIRQNTAVAPAYTVYINAVIPLG